MSTPHVRVYSRYETIDHETTWYAWACDLRRARPVLLGPRSADPFLIDYVRNLRIAAPYVAFEHFEQDHYGKGAEHVDVVDLRSGRKVHAWSRGFECPSVELVALRLTARGYELPIATPIPSTIAPASVTTISDERSETRRKR